MTYSIPNIEVQITERKLKVALAKIENRNDHTIIGHERVMDWARFVCLCGVVGKLHRSLYLVEQDAKQHINHD